jgi:hypothetical protein
MRPASPRDLQLEDGSRISINGSGPTGGGVFSSTQANSKAGCERHAVAWLTDTSKSLLKHAKSKLQ